MWYNFEVKKKSVNLVGKWLQNFFPFISATDGRHKIHPALNKIDYIS